MDGMATEKLFRETPFNGYNREDVKAYLKDLDIQKKEFEERCREDCVRLEEQLESQKAEIEKLNGMLTELNERMTAKTDENLRLSSELLSLKNRELEQANIITEKTEELLTLQKQLEQANLKIQAAEKKEKPSESVGTVFEENIRRCIEKANRLKREVEQGYLRTSSEDEYKRKLEEKDKTIRDMEGRWEQCKKDYAVYLDVRNNAEQIKNDARSKAEQIIAEAKKQADEIILAAKQTSDRIIAEAKENEESIRARVDSLKASVESIINTIQFMDPSDSDGSDKE